jgi:RNA polymerase sigma-70 factor (ECF subfamily)
MHERVHALRNREVLGAWLYRVVRNVIADRYRARRRLGEPPNEDDLVADNDGMPRDVKAERAVCVAPFVARLPSPYREAVTVVDIEGLSLKDAAAMVGISTTAMKSRVQRGRARLRELFECCCELDLDVRRRVVDYRCKPGRDRCDGGSPRSRR